MPVTALTVTLPERDSPDAQIASIQARGNMPLIVGERLVAEIDRRDLLESWQTAAELSPEELIRMSKTAGSRLAQTIDENIDATNLTDAVTDAAVLFLLTLRRKGVRTPDEIQPCTVLWDDEAAQEYLLLQA
jgi:hypothetical protein